MIAELINSLHVPAAGEMDIEVHLLVAFLNCLCQFQTFINLIYPNVIAFGEYQLKSLIKIFQHAKYQSICFFDAMVNV